MPNDAVGILFDEITAERGGQQSFSVVELSLARQLAVMLANPASKADPAVVARLLEMLPAKSTEPAADLSKLSDAQFSQLERLMAIARGQTPPRPIPRKPPPKPLTPRGYRAAELADLLDKIDDEHRKPTDGELLQCRNHLSGIMGILAPLSSLLPVSIYATPAIPLPEAAPTPEPEHKAPLPPPTPAFDNVVPLPFTDEERGALKYGAVLVGGTGGHFGDNPLGR
jgi:hypothetical protein